MMAGAAAPAADAGPAAEEKSEFDLALDSVPADWTNQMPCLLFEYKTTILTKSLMTTWIEHNCLLLIQTNDTFIVFHILKIIF